MSDKDVYLRRFWGLDAEAVLGPSVTVSSGITTAERLITLHGAQVGGSSDATLDAILEGATSHTKE